MISATTTCLARARVPSCLLDPPPSAGGELALVDIELMDGRIAAVRPGTGAVPRHATDLGGRIVLPGFVDMHTHLDKGHIWPRAANPDGSFWAALETVEADRRANWKAEDVLARMEFALRCASAHGTVAIRTHLDSRPPQAQISFPVFAELRDRWRGRIELQAVSLAMLEDYRGRDGERLADLVAAHGAVLGVVPLPGPDLDADLDRFLALAAERGLAVDCHVDETLDPEVRTLRHLADTMLRRGFTYPAVAGHCCSLAAQLETEMRATLDRVRAAGIAIVSLPMCNMYLQDRVAGRTPRRRGVTVLHEARSAGVPVAVASDNTRDPFYAYGDLDMHEVFREAVRIAHLDHPVGDWVKAVTATPAALIGLPERGRIAPGLPADLVILEGRSWSEAFSRPEAGRVVLRAGVAIDTRPPPYTELDHLFA